MKITTIRKIKYMFIGCIIFIINFELFLENPYKRLKNEIKNSLNFFHFNNKITRKVCKLERIFSLPYNATVIIGHAYGSKKRDNGYISSNVEDFLIHNAKKIKMVIFTGDVFLNPSLRKWEKLKDQFGEEFKIIIAPGNHDVGLGNIDNSMREAFEKSSFSSNLYPYLLKESNANLIIEDSNINFGDIQDGLINLINKIPEDSKIFVLRHHIPIVELSSYSNIKIKDSFNNFNNLKAQTNREVTFISGDSGQKIYHPRYSCHSRENLTFITNGIGDFKNDTILILNNQKIYRYVLN